MRLAWIAGLAAATCAGQVLLQHDYDALGDRVTAVAVRAGESAVQSFTAPQGGGTAAGLRLKLRRVGSPGPLAWRLGDVASGELAPEGVQPYFEAWAALPVKPVALVPGRRYEIRITAGAGSGYYEWYGTTGQGPETAVNQDYGVSTPAESLAFQVLGPAGAPANIEEPFRFIGELIAPQRYRRARHWKQRGGADEVTLDATWSLELPPSAGPAARTAAEEFREYLGQSMGITLQGTGEHRIVAATGGQMTTPEGFTIELKPGGITITGADDRGMMRGLFHLQDLLDLRQAPILKTGTLVRTPRYNPRITCAPFLAGEELEPESDPYTDGLLSKIAHSGYNAIWVWGKLYELGRSPALPELGAEAPARLARLKALVDRAARHGIDVYVYFTLDPLPPAFFEKRPEARGIERSAGRFFGTPGYLLCTSAPVVQRWLEEAAASVFRGAPGLRGAIMIPGGEGMFNCRSGHGPSACPRCANRARDEVLAEMLKLVQRGVHSAAPRAEVATWTYTWPETDPTRAGLIARLPRDMVWLATFEKEGIIRRDSVEDRAYDYTISYLGPSDNFRLQLPLVEKTGMPLWVKTEAMVSQEFVQAPYIPVPQRWIVRYRRIAAYPRVSGLFMSWNHYGFVPSRAAELAKWYTWDPMPEGSELLLEIARRDFGAAAAPLFVQAWERLSDAIGNYPLSDYTSRTGPVQKGPAHPFFTDPGYQPRHGQRRQFYNHLNWTLPWDIPIARKYFGAMERSWANGVELLHKAAAAVAPEDRAEASREIGIAEMQLSCISMALNLMEFYQLRAELGGPADAKVIRRRMGYVLEKEKENALRALPWVEADSRLGFANGGNGLTNGGVRAGIFTAAAIRKKLAQIDRALAELR